MSEKEIAIIPKLYDAMIWFSGKLGKYPKSYRFNVGEKIFAGFLSVLDLILEAQYASGTKSHLLRRANLELEKLRFLIRLSKDLQCISLAEYENAAGHIVELGKMVGGWEKHTRRKESE